MPPKLKRRIALALLTLAALAAALVAAVAYRDRQVIRQHTGLTPELLLVMNCRPLDEAQQQALIGHATQIHSSDPDGFFSASGQYRILRRGLFSHVLEYTTGPFPATHYFCEL